MEHQVLLIFIIIILSIAAFFLSKRIAPKVNNTLVMVFETENQIRFELAQNLLHEHHFEFQIHTTKDAMLALGTYQIWVDKTKVDAVKAVLETFI